MHGRRQEPRPGVIRQLHVHNLLASHFTHGFHDLIEIGYLSGGAEDFAFVFVGGGENGADIFSRVVDDVDEGKFGGGFGEVVDGKGAVALGAGAELLGEVLHEGARGEEGAFDGKRSLGRGLLAGLRRRNVDFLEWNRSR